MMFAVNILSEALVGADGTCDYAPIYSTATNLIALFQKCVIFPLVSDLPMTLKRALFDVLYFSFPSLVILLLLSMITGYFEAIHLKKKRFGAWT
jgi:hypothetical protein